MTTHPVGVGIYQCYNDRVIRAVLQSVVTAPINQQLYPVICRASNVLTVPKCLGSKVSCIRSV